MDDDGDDDLDEDEDEDEDKVDSKKYDSMMMTWRWSLISAGMSMDEGGVRGSIGAADVVSGRWVGIDALHWYSIDDDRPDDGDDDDTDHDDDHGDDHDDDDGYDRPEEQWSRSILHWRSHPRRGRDGLAEWAGSPTWSDEGDDGDDDDDDDDMIMTIMINDDDDDMIMTMMSMMDDDDDDVMMRRIRIL